MSSSTKVFKSYVVHSIQEFIFLSAVRFKLALFSLHLPWSEVERFQAYPSSTSTSPQGIQYFRSFMLTKTHYSVCYSLSKQPKAYLLGYKSHIHHYWVSDQASMLQKPSILHYQLIWWKISLSNTLTCLIGVLNNTSAHKQLAIPSVLDWIGNPR